MRKQLKQNQESTRSVDAPNPLFLACLSKENALSSFDCVASARSMAPGLLAAILSDLGILLYFVALLFASGLRLLVQIL